MNQLTAFAQSFQSRTAAGFDADDDYSFEAVDDFLPTGGEDKLNNGDCETVLRRVQEKGHPGREFFLKFMKKMEPAQTKLIEMAGGSDAKHLRPLHNAYVVFANKANTLASSLGTMRMSKEEDPKSETLLAAMYVTTKILKRVSAESGGRSELPQDVEEAAALAVEQLRELQEDVNGAWRELGVGAIAKMRLAKQLGASLGTAFRSVKTFKTVESRGELVLSLPIVGAYTLFQPIYPALLPQ